MTQGVKTESALDAVKELLDKSGLSTEDKVLWMIPLMLMGEGFQKSFIKIFSDNADLLREATTNLKLKNEILKNSGTSEKLIEQENTMLQRALQNDQNNSNT